MILLFFFLTQMADGMKNMLTDRSPVAAEFLSLQWSLYICCFVSVIGGGFFLATAFFIVEDRARAEKAVRGKDND